MEGYIARDKSGDLFFYADKPHKADGNIWLSDDPNDYVKLPRLFFTELKWEDEEPRRVTITVE
ncbi:MAG: hypothetical protein Q4E59_00610 [Bacteroidales bacterium]|nr:hypothetical protein [Bacteroidales bacterium]